MKEMWNYSQDPSDGLKKIVPDVSEGLNWSLTNEHVDKEKMRQK